MAALAGRIYVIGGFNATGGVVATVEVYDPARDAWASVKPLPVAGHHVNAAPVGGKLYVVGMLQGTSFTASGLSYAYDPGADEWTARSAMPPGSERGASGVAAIGAKIYVGGGLRGTAVADHWAYDTGGDAWERLPDLPAPRDHLVAGAVGGIAYFIGGRMAAIGSHSPRVFAYDPVGRAFAERAAMPTSRGGAAGAVVGGRIVVAGGEGNSADPSGVFPQVEVYDPARDAWDALPPMLTPRHGTGGAAPGTTFYVPGGATRAGFGATAIVEALAL